MPTANSETFEINPSVPIVTFMQRMQEISILIKMRKDSGRRSYQRHDYE